MSALGLGVALFVKPTAVLAAAAALTWCLRRGSAAARHAVWAAAIAATLAIPLLSVVIPEIRIACLPPALDPGTALFGAPRTIARGPLAAGERSERSERSERLGSRPAAGSSRAALAGSRERLAVWPELVWLLGVLALGARRLVAMLRVRRLISRAEPVTDRRILRVFGEAARRSGARPGAVELRIGDEIPAPATAGAARAVVMLPAKAAHWMDAELAAVFAHELGHVVRRDCLVNTVADVAATLHWCNPLVRLAVRRLKRESEHACDDAVLRSGVRAGAYARLLLRVASAGQHAPPIPEPAVPIARARELETRLLAVLDAGIVRQPPRRWQTASLVVLAMLPSLPAAALTLAALRAPTPRIASPEPDTLGDALAAPGSERLPSDAPAIGTGSRTALLLGGPDSTLARALVKALEHEPTHEGDLVRDRAAWALAQARSGRLVEPLLAALYSPDWRARACAAWALAVAGEPRAVPRLVELLSDPVWRMRAMAAFALRVAADPRAEAAMAAALTDPAWQVRMEAVEYVAAMAGPRMRDRLVPLLADRHVAVRHAAERALNP